MNYTEITTRTGKQEAYQKFGYRDGRHPLFFALSKHPLDYRKDDRLLVIEWCKWKDTEEMQDDMMAFVNSFSDESSARRWHEQRTLQCGRSSEISWRSTSHPS